MMLALQTANHAMRYSKIRILIACLFGSAAAVSAQIPSSSYPARRAAALSRIGTDLLIVPARASFLADDPLGFVQAADFQYLTGLDQTVGGVLVLDGARSTSTLFVQPSNPLVTVDAIVPGAESARQLQVADVQAVEGLETWLRRRFAQAKTSAY